MGLVYTEITLKNSTDVGNVEGGALKKQDVRETTVTALVDTGAGTLVISEAVRERLGLCIRGLRHATLANNAKELCKVTSPVEVHWKDRSATCRALVVPNEGEVLLGVIPLEDMDLMVDPKRQELVGAHGSEELAMLKTMSK